MIHDRAKKKNPSNLAAQPRNAGSTQQSPLVVEAKESRYVKGVFIDILSRKRQGCLIFRGPAGRRPLEKALLVLTLQATFFSAAAT